MNTVAEQLMEKGFSNSQIQEIREGIDAGLNTEIYARKNFLAVQMRQIRLGLENGVPVEWYAKAEYDWFQMEEIRKGLEAHVDVSLFASPDIPYDRMQQIRLGLEAGMDLSSYKKLSAGILKQMRLALLKRVNIIPYIIEGYDTEQLEAIREALEKTLDIQPWVRKEYRGVALHEIFTGLENECDVSVYAKPEYNWQQMREIRLGIEHRVDISQYGSVFYSYMQMQEIRLGLEAGVDISYYRSPMYTASQMQERRRLLEENPAAFLSERLDRQDVEDTSEGWSDKEEQTNQNVQITLSEDETEAYLTVSGSIEELTRVDVVKAIRKKGICYGIHYDVIDDVIRGNSPRRTLLIAKGKKRIDGEDGWYELFFRTDFSGIPKLLETGEVDYRDVEWFETVEKGQKLAVYHPAKKGENGITVTGSMIPARRGREKGQLIGKGFLRLQDGVTYVSLIHGVVTLQEYRLNVTEMLVMQEVNMMTGDVEYDGSVLVEGNVCSGSTIKAGKDVIVNGYVEDAKIICGGSAYLRNGMNGAGGGTVRANENVTGYFFERAEIYAGGNIQGDYFFNCSLLAQGEVLAIGKKGSIAGGIACAENGLRVRSLGNSAGLPTSVVLGREKQLRKKEEKVQTEKQEVGRELHIFQNAHQEFQRKYSLEILNTMEIYLKVESAIYTKEKELEKLAEEMQRLELEIQKSGHVSATIEDVVYDGVTIEIDGARWKAKEVKAATIMKRNKKIVVHSI